MAEGTEPLASTPTSSTSVSPTDARASEASARPPVTSPSRQGNLTGERVGGYLVEELLGVGGMAEVYRALDIDLQRNVAVKVLASALTNDAEYITRFRSEARRVAALHNSHIVPVYQAGEVEFEGKPLLFLVMPLLRESLGQKLQREGPLPYAEAVRLTLEVADGLQMAHDAGLIHRDVKPGNILLNDEGNALLADFGLARATHPTPLDFTLPKGSKQAFGTPEYMAPEQLQGASADVRTDIYSLGVMLYEQLTGRLPFGHGTSYEIAGRALYAPLIPPSAVVDRSHGPFPPTLDEVVLTALARDPRDRFTNMAAFAQALHEAVRTGEMPEALHVRQTTGPRWTLPWLKRMPKERQARNRRSLSAVKRLIPWRWWP